MDVKHSRPQSRPSLGASDADAISQVYHVRTYPLPPGDLIPIEPTDHEHYNDLIESVVAPHWNSAVDLLKGGGGYLALARLRDRLVSHIEEYDRRMELAWLPKTLTQWADRILQHEASAFGPDTTLGSSLCNEGLISAERPWRWEPRWSRAQLRGEYVAADAPALFALRSSGLDELVAVDGEGSLARRFLEFGRDQSWRDAISANQSQDLGLPFGPNKEEECIIDLIKFRLDVVTRVLREYEWLGYVGDFGAGGLRRIDLDEEQRAFLNAAIDAIESIESEGANRSWYEIMRRLEMALQISDKKVRRIAKKRFAMFGGPAFVPKKVGEDEDATGRPVDEEVEDRFDRFCSVMRSYAAAAGMQ